MTTRTKAILGLSGFFVVGALIGAAVVGIIVRDRVREVRDLREHEGFLRFVERRLDLTVAQRDSLQGELDSLYAQLQRLRTTTARELSAVLDTFRTRVEPRLTPRQRELLQHQEEFLRHDLPHPRGGHRSPVGRPLPPPWHLAPPKSDTAYAPAARNNDSVPRRPAMRATADDSAGNTAGTFTPRARSARPPEPVDSSLHGVYRLERMLARLGDDLKLSPLQQTEIRSLMASARERGRSVLDQFRDRPALRRIEMRRLIADTRRRLFEVLTHDQRQALRHGHGFRRGRQW